MTTSISLINSLNNLNMINQMLGTTTSSSSLNSLLSNISGTSSLLSSTATNLQAANLTALKLITAAGPLTSSNPLTVFTGASTQDATKIKNAVTNFVTAFNNAIGSLSGSSNAISNQSATSLTALAKANATALSAIGITIDNAGKLVVDSTKLQTAATSNQTAIQTAFNGSASFASKVTAASRSAISQGLGLTSSTGFMALYTSSLSSGTSSLLSSSSLFSIYL